jgi:hypothetical protein
MTFIFNFGAGLSVSTTKETYGCEMALTGIHCDRMENRFNSFSVLGNAKIVYHVTLQLVYDTVNFINPEQFTIAISKYDDTYMAQRFIEYFKLLSKDATTPKLLEEMRVRSNR